MRSSIPLLLLTFFSALIAARPRPQNIDFTLVNDTPDPTAANITNVNVTAIITDIIADIYDDPTLSTRDAVLWQRTPPVNPVITVVTSQGYNAPFSLGNAAINAPLDCNGVNTYMGSKLFTTDFNTDYCAVACSATSAYSLRHPPSVGLPRTCQFFNTYAMYQNGNYQGQYCAMYTESWDSSYATNTGQYSGSDHYTIQNSYISSNAVSPGVPSPACSAAPNPFLLQVAPGYGKYSGSYVSVNVTTGSPQLAASSSAATMLYICPQSYLSFSLDASFTTFSYADQSTGALTGRVHFDPPPTPFGSSNLLCTFNNQAPYTVSCNSGTSLAGWQVYTSDGVVGLGGTVDSGAVAIKFLVQPAPYYGGSAPQ